MRVPKLWDPVDRPYIIKELLGNNLSIFELIYNISIAPSSSTFIEPALSRNAVFPSSRPRTNVLIFSLSAFTSCIIGKYMLNTSPLSPNPSPPGIRRRGGQPSNHNALKHGFFAVHNLTPFTPRLEPVQTGSPQSQSAPLLRSMCVRQAALAGQLHNSMEEWPGVELGPLLARAIQSTRQQITLTFDAASHATGFNSILTWQRALLRHIDLFLRYSKALARYQQLQLHLDLCASHTLALIRRDFQENGLPLAPHSFRGTPESSDFNSSAFQKADFPSKSEFLNPSSHFVTGL